MEFVIEHLKKSYEKKEVLKDIAFTFREGKIYQIAMFATYLVCYSMMQVRLPIPVFGLACIAFCLVYSLVASILVYRLAPKTFRIRP